MEIDHVAIAVRSMTAALETFKTVWGLEPDRLERVDSDKIAEAMLPLGGVHLQLIEPLDETSTVARFLDRRGEGLHHIALRVSDIEATLDRLRQVGAHLVDEQPRIGGGGHRVAFVHPKTTAGVLIELVEHQDTTGSRSR